MFPEFEDIDITPDEEIEEIEEEEKPIGRTPLFNFEKGEYVVKDGKVVECTKEEAIKQWVAFLVKTAAGKFDVYNNTQFGTDISNYIGFKDTGFVASEIERELTEKVTQNRAIDCLENFEAERNGDSMKIKITIKMKDESEVAFDVEV